MNKALLLGIPLAAIGFALFQQHRLSELNLRIELLGGTGLSSRSAGEPASSTSRRGERLPLDMHSMAGEETLPELMSLAAGIAEERRASSREQRYIRQLAAGHPKLSRLQGLLAGLGAGAAEKLLASLDDPLTKSTITGSYREANPQEFFFWSLISPRETGFSYLNFRDWGYLDPARALQWYREALARKDPLAEGIAMQTCAAVMESRVEPARAVADLKAILNQHPEHWADSEVREIAQQFFVNLRDGRDFMSFLIALQPSATGAVEETPHLREFRDKVVYWTKERLKGLSGEEGIPVVEKGFTPQERRDFARKQAGSLVSQENSANAASWIPWLAAVDSPPDQKHPLRIMARCAGERNNVPEPAWLDSLPGSPLKDLALQDYVEARTTIEPSVAARWLTKIPAGPERADMAKKIAAALQTSDPGEASALLEREGIRP